MGQYVCAENRAQGLAVWCWRGEKVSPEDWARHLKDMESIREWTELPFRPGVIIYSVDSAFSPNASQRAQIAKSSSSVSYRVNLAVVSHNPLVRGVMKAFSWVQGSKPYRIAPFAELSGAISWLEKERGEPLPLLFPLLEQAHQRLDYSPEAVLRAKQEVAAASSRRGSSARASLL